MDELTRKRMEHNEAVFRAVNEEIDEASNRATREYVCECSDVSCTETIHLTHEEYTRIRERENRFVLVPGHEIPDLEDVVRREPEYLVVEKR